MSDKTAKTSQLLEAGETGEKIAKAAPALLAHGGEALRFPTQNEHSDRDSRSRLQTDSGWETQN